MSYPVRQYRQPPVAARRRRVRQPLRYHRQSGSIGIDSTSIVLHTQER